MARTFHVSVSVLCLGILCLPGSVGATTWTVDKQGGGDAVTIQDAVDAASSGDTVRVASGTYAESVTIAGKGLTLVSISGPDATAIDPVFSGRAILLASTGSQIRIEGFTITRGRAEGIETDNAGGGVAAYQSPLIVENCRFLQNSAFGTGGGIYATFSPRPGFPGVSVPLFLAVVACRFESNYAAGDGGGLYADEVPSTVTDCRFLNNDAVLGGGIGFLHLEHTVRGCEFEKNTGLSGGGLSFTGNGFVRVEDSVFRKNLANNYGGGVHAVGGIGFELDHCVFEENQARDGAGAALIRTPLAATFVFWHENLALRTSGGLYLENPDAVTLERCTWIGNQAPVTASLGLGSGSSSVVRCLFLDEGESPVNCSQSLIDASCNFGIPPGECFPLEPATAAACPSDDGALCPLPETACGIVGHAERDCEDPGCSTPVVAVTWGRIKGMYTDP